MVKKIKYSKKTYYNDEPTRSRDTDLGIDLPTAQGVGLVQLDPGDTAIIDTGISFEFPIFNKVQRFLSRLIFGVDILGVGGLVWPRGRDNYAVLSGVIDTGYRGSVKVKILNTTDKPISFFPGRVLAQMVPILTLNIPLSQISHVRKDTDRGTSGGINELR